MKHTLRRLIRRWILAALVVAPVGCDSAGPGSGDGGALGGETPIVVQQLGTAIPAGGSFYTPLNNTTLSVSLFTEQRDLFIVKNVSKADVTLDAVSLASGAGTHVKEFTLQNTDPKPGPLVVSSTVLSPGATFQFYVRFFPLAGGKRSADVAVTFNGQGSYPFTITGTGQTKAAFFSGGAVDYQKLLGGPKTDELLTALVANPRGELFFSANAAELVEKTGGDILIGQITSTGALGWAKVWAGPYRDLSRDPGQNLESGGSASAMSLDSDGYLYVVGSRSVGSSNNLFQTLVLKIDPANGAVLWEKVFCPCPSPTAAKHNAEAYAVDASGKFVYVTGATAANTDLADAHVLLLSLRREDGMLMFKKSIEVWPGFADRGYAARQDGQGSLYIGGSGNSDAFLLKVADVETTSPRMLWAQKIAVGSGGGINSVDVDEAGNAFVALDRRGASSYFSAARIDASGALAWAKTYGAGVASDKNNVHVVRVEKGEVFLGGRIGLSGFDTTQGDAMVLRLKADGTLVSSAFHFSGKGSTDIAEHRVKGLAFAGGGLFVASQVTTGIANTSRYAGFWYDGLGTLEEYKPAVVAIPGAAVYDLPLGSVQDASALRQFLNAPATLLLQDAGAKSNGTAPDADLSIARFTLQ
jgi:hypothetical protein